VTQDLTASTSEILQYLPHTLRLRFQSISKYATALAGEALPDGTRLNLGAEDLRQLNYAAVVYILREFLQSGARAARSAVNTFEDLGLKGFSVGRSHFTRHSEATRRGERLAKALDAKLRGTLIAQKMRASRNIRDFLQAVAKELDHGSRSKGL